ncbi:hypothetical protein GCM10010472_01210 [Pseudonocardia halophobica]|uniref:Uncharacterized protein n=1 Tax=Pseudonocardia halophobica TaxID=29401 RepID=A0A9W6L1I2_9PSEU|nr:hypothetical protein [Pseudonocardia halophobica]GLL10461.1 hypothetical protein GCM10017577_16010 [Pseudonocardia halophobica]
MGAVDLPLAPALLTLRGFVITVLRAQGALRVAGEFLPGIGVVSIAEFQAAMRAARTACLASDRSTAVSAISEVLTPGWRSFRTPEARAQAIADARSLLAFVETHAERTAGPR